MKKSIYWFRKNLRLRDNPSLFNAIKDNDEIIFIYIIKIKNRGGKYFFRFVIYYFEF